MRRLFAVPVGLMYVVSLFVSSLATLFLAATASADSATLTPTLDTMVYSAKPNNAYATTTPLYASNGSYLTFMRFDASVITNSGGTINSVTFTPYINYISASNVVLNIYAIDANWSATSTWNNSSSEQAACSGTPVASVTIPKGAVKQTMTLPVSAIPASGAVNFCLVSNTSTSQIRVGSSEGTKPQLAITSTPAPVPGAPSTLMTIQDKAFTDLSSWASSLNTPGIWWSNEDRTHQSPQAFAFNSSGQTVATVTMTGDGMTNIDPEDLNTVLLNNVPYVYVSDGGGNLDIRSSVIIHRFVDPSLNPTQTGQSLTIPADTWVFNYPPSDLNPKRTAGPDSETLFVNPATGQVYIAIKTKGGLAGSPTSWGIYAAPPESAGTPGTYQLTKIGSTSLSYTSGAWSTDGTEIAFLSYTHVYIYKVQNGDVATALTTTPVVMTPPTIPQSEGIDFSTDGQAVEISTEDHNTKPDNITRLPLPSGYTVAPATYYNGQP